MQQMERHKVLEPRKDVWWEEGGIFNPAVVELSGRIHLMYRAVGRDHLSRFGLAVSSDGLNFERLDLPIFESDPLNQYERLGIEDPRATLLGRDIYITYTAASVYPAGHLGSFSPSLNTPKVPWRVRVSALKTRDMRHFQRLGIWLPDLDSKNAVLFPEKIQGKFWLLHRIVPSIYLASSTNLRRFENTFQIMEPRFDWEKIKIGVACPPIKTEKGWLVFHHGVDQSHRYSIGASLLSLKNPAHVISRTSEPLITPQLTWERLGVVNNVIFVTGSIWKHDRIWLYYGAADRVIGCIQMTLSTVFTALDV